MCQTIGWWHQLRFAPSPFPSTFTPPTPTLPQLFSKEISFPVLRMRYHFQMERKYGTKILHLSLIYRNEVVIDLKFRFMCKKAGSDNTNSRKGSYRSHFCFYYSLCTPCSILLKRAQGEVEFDWAPQTFFEIKYKWSFNLNLMVFTSKSKLRCIIFINMNNKENIMMVRTNICKDKCLYWCIKIINGPRKHSKLWKSIEMGHCKFFRLPSVGFYLKLQKVPRI